MSVQAMSWALEQRAIADPTARHVLLCLANYADKKGGNAFPSAASLSLDTGLSERAVRSKLADLERAGVIRRGNQVVASAHIGRADRRPVVFDIVMDCEVHHAHPAELSGVRQMHPAESTGCTTFRDGVHQVPERGAPPAPNPSLNHQGTGYTSGAAALTGLTGSFEGHPPAPAGQPQGTAAGRAAVELVRLGFRVTSMDPNLIAACAEGVTVELLLEFAAIYPPDHPKSAGSAAYIVGAARRQLAQSADPAMPGARHAADRGPRESAAGRVRRIAEAAEQRDRDAAGAGADRHPQPVGSYG